MSRHTKSGSTFSQVWGVLRDIRLTVFVLVVITVFFLRKPYFFLAALILALAYAIFRIIQDLRKKSSER